MQFCHFNGSYWSTGVDEILERIFYTLLRIEFLSTKKLFKFRKK